MIFILVLYLQNNKNEITNAETAVINKKEWQKILFLMDSNRMNDLQ